MNAPITLACLAHAGGVASRFYEPWTRLLPGEVTVLPLDLLGRGNRCHAVRTPALDVPEIVADLAGILQPHTTGRWAIFGHSFGALLAYELACQLQVLGCRRPESVFVSGRRAPQLAPAARVSQLDDDALVEAVARWGGLEGWPLEHRSLRQMFLPHLRCDLQLSETHVVGDRRRLDCSVRVLCGTDDPLVDAAGLAAWSGVTTGEMSTHRFGGGHFYLDQPADLIGWLAMQLNAG